MRSFRIIPDDTRIPFVRYRYVAYAFSGFLVLLTLILVPVLYDIVEHRPDWLRFGKKQRAQVEEFRAHRDEIIGT